ncbi:hemolysin III family protein [Mollicutes bacterium LVI A0039]|nr:hemolysin III family protein [Mollicutes bacterium LVI A0039]
MEKVDQDTLFKYSKREDNLNFITHAIGALLALLGIGFLLINHQDASLVIKIGVVVYGLSMFALFTASSLYHYEQNPERRALFKRLDHAMILVMISGTYAPLCLVMGTTSSYIILGLVYILSLIGIALKVKYINVRSSVSIAIYLIVGWLAVFMIKDMYLILDPIVMYLIVTGGIVYSLGALVYAFTKFEFHHALWHVFVLVAAISFFFAVHFALYV